MGTGEVKPVSGREAPPPKPRRFYKTVSVADEGGTLCVMLDGKPVRTPLRNLLGTPKRALADALAAEWDAQDPVIDREAMPLTRMVATAIDRIGPEREAIISSLMAYIDSDLLCYRATYPTALKVRQAEAWQPVLDWLHENVGARLTYVEGVMPIQQPKDAASAMKQAIESLSDENLMAFQACAAITKSLALSMALVHRYLDADEVAACAHLDETFQAEQWGEDREALMRQRIIETEIRVIKKYISLLEGDSQS
tara:strand:+ start:740 stop:1501 length:762 start_codon:yes stop_codon:yes gene_type:complete